MSSLLCSSSPVCPSIIFYLITGFLWIMRYTHGHKWLPSLAQFDLAVQHSPWWKWVLNKLQSIAHIMPGTCLCKWSFTIHLCIIHGCTHAPMTELSRCERHQMAGKSKIFTIWPFTEKVCWSLSWSNWLNISASQLRNAGKIVYRLSSGQISVPDPIT